MKESFEEELAPNVVYCDKDDFVLSIAKKLGAYLELASLKPSDKFKLVYADESIMFNGKAVKNLYAFLNFNGSKESNDNGLLYLKIYDIINNKDKFDLFAKSINLLGGKFDQVYFSERYPDYLFN